MGFLRKFAKEHLGKSPGAKPASAGKAPGSGGLIDPFAEGEKSEDPDGGKSPSSGGLIDPFAEGEQSEDPDGGKAPSSGGLIDPFAEGEKSEEPDGGKAPASGGLIDPFKEDAASPAAAEDTEAQTKEFFDKAEALYKKKQYAAAAEQYQSAYKIASADQRGSLAFNSAQAFRLAKNFPNAVVWYQKALALGGPGVNEHRAEIEERLAQVQGDMKKHPSKGADGKDLSEAQMLFEEAQIAYGEKDYAKAIPLYKQAYSRSNLSAILFNIGQACRLAGQAGDAKYWYREYLKKEPNSPHKAEIEKHIEELKKKAPDLPKEGDAGAEDDARAKFERAERLYKVGMYSEAADLYVEVFHDPAVAFARGEMAFNLGQCMRQTGKATSAVEWYKKALEHLPDNSPSRTEIADRIAELTGAKTGRP